MTTGKHPETEYMVWKVTSAFALTVSAIMILWISISHHFFMF